MLSGAGPGYPEKDTILREYIRADCDVYKLSGVSQRYSAGTVSDLFRLIHMSVQSNMRTGLSRKIKLTNTLSDGAN